MATRGFLRALRWRSLQIGRSLVRTDMVWAWLVLAVSLAVTLWVSHAATTYAQRDAAALFALRQAEIVGAIHNRMQAYEHVLRGGLALFMATGEITRTQWQTYVQHLQIEAHYPGIQGVGYIKWIVPANKEIYVAQIRAEGFPTFSLRPDGVRPEYTSITYIEPFDKRNQQAFGYDMWSEPVRRTAMQTARDTATTTISGKVTLVQEIDADRQAGVLIYLPRYGRGEAPATVAERRTNLVGFVYSTFRMRNLMEGILGRTWHDIGLKIFDGPKLSTDTLMYDSEVEMLFDQQEISPALTATVPLDIHGHTWTARFHTLPTFHAALDTSKPRLALAAGGLISLLLFWLLWAFAATRTRAAGLARLTGELDRTVRELARSNAELEQFAYVASHDLKAPLRGIDNLATWIEEDLGEVLVGEAQENMQLLRGRTRQLDALLNGLLQYSRIGRIPVPVEPADVGQLVTDVFAVLNTQHTFSLVLPHALPAITTARIPLEQVFANLFANAIRHHDGVRGQLQVSGYDQGEYYEFTVADDGPGIASEYHDRVFQMFQCLKSRDEVEGSGMGLTIIKKIIEEQGGRIWIEDTTGIRGATFRFTWRKQWQQKGVITGE